MADNVNRLKRYGPAIFLLGLLSGVGLGYALFHHSPLVATAPNSPVPSTTTAPMDNSAKRNLRANNFRANNFVQYGNAEERRAQGFLDQITPDQRERMQSLRAQMRQNAGEWRNLTPEERRQRLQTELNLTPEQQEQLQQRLESMRDRARNRNPR